MEDWRNLGEKKKKRIFCRGTVSKIAVSQKEAWKLTNWVGMAQSSLKEIEKYFKGDVV